MSTALPFQRRIRSLVDAAGGKKPLARKLGVTDSAINSWLKGSHPFPSKLADACAHSGLSLEWLRDGIGKDEVELSKIGGVYRHGNGRGYFTPTGDSRPIAGVEEEAGGSSLDGWRVVVRVLADRLTSTQIAEALNEILSHREITESVRNHASQILIAAQLPKLKR